MSYRLLGFCVRLVLCIILTVRLLLYIIYRVNLVLCVIKKVRLFCISYRGWRCFFYHVDREVAFGFI